MEIGKLLGMFQWKQSVFLKFIAMNGFSKWKNDWKIFKFQAVFLSQLFFFVWDHVTSKKKIDDILYIKNSLNIFGKYIQASYIRHMNFHFFSC